MNRTITTASSHNSVCVTASD